MEGVRILDFGIRGIDLMFALQDEHDAVILVDAAPRGEPPGTLYVIEPDPEPAERTEEGITVLDGHRLDPATVLRLASALGGGTRRVLLVGCEPAELGTDLDPVMGLSASVAAAVDEAVRLIDSHVAELLHA
jgi:hydrogenase maturation protease